MKKKSLIFAALVFASLATGCSATKEGNESASESSRTMINAEQESEKYNQYVELSNNYIALADTERTYAENRIDESGNFKPADAQNATGMYSILLDSKTITKLEKLARSKPKMDIDQEVTAFLKILRKEVATFEEIENYYDEKDFLNDSNEKGKVLHDKLVAIYAEIEDPAKKFNDKLDVLIKEREVKDRKENEAAGNVVSLTIQDFLDAADEASTAAYDGIDEEGTVILTAEQYAEVNAKVSKTADAFKAILEDEKALENEGYQVVNVSLFNDRVSNFKRISNELSASFGTENVTTAIDALTDNYSVLIDSYNSMIAI